MSDSNTPDDMAAEDAVVHVIQSRYHYRDHDNRLESDEALVVEEGWFADAASAAVRCEQLNAQSLKFYDAAVARQKRDHDAKVREAEQKNLEAAAIRAAGMPKEDVRVPGPFVPPTLERFFSQTNHTSYESVAVRRSDHDGIARAPQSGAVGTA